MLINGVSYITTITHELRGCCNEIICFMLKCFITASFPGLKISTTVTKIGLNPMNKLSKSYCHHPQSEPEQFHP